jgi:hypothetical protein
MYDHGVMEKRMLKAKMFLAQNEDNGNKVCMMGTKVYWHHYDAKCEPSWMNICCHHFLA